ncbi:hypothetical protein Ahy_B05g079187 isoform A [Arachis hypogaea]|uniref:Protein FAR1-RELATED SEQUENCE n=1 Tax=Arachis hypogaea TaxID=3818 RepID=A0A444Z959_ARAHY|nr:hypothetical protein Ahy_B05g079187 isoform A [Arachis hypogaea]
MALLDIFEFFEDQHLWIPIYLDHYFWVEMKSTQRSESIHTFFNNSLIQFVKQYNNCLGSNEQKEREYDTPNFYTIILCATKPPIEAHTKE